MSSSDRRNTPQASALLSLPAELLEAIFEDVYANAVPLAPPCRALLPLHDKLLKRRHAKVKVAGSDMLQCYSSTIQTRNAVGMACQSLKVTSNYHFPHNKLPDVTFQHFFVPLTNLRTLHIDNAQLASAFVEHVDESPASPFPHLESLSLTPAERDPIAVQALRKLTSLRSMTLALQCPTEPAEDDDEAEMAAFPKLTFISLAIRGGDLSGIIQIIASAPALRSLDVKRYAANATYGALLEAAAKLGTVTKLTLSGTKSISWKAPKQLKSFSVLTDLSLGTGCTARDAPSFKLLRRLPIQNLSFGSGTVVSDSHVLSLITGADKHNSLQTIVLNNVYAWCDNVQDWDWHEDAKILWIWLREGYTLPHWTKTFSRDGCEKLIEAAESEGLALSGSSVDALDIEDLIIKNKADVEGYLERKERRERRELRALGLRY